MDTKVQYSLENPLGQSRTYLERPSESEADSALPDSSASMSSPTSSSHSSEAIENHPRMLKKAYVVQQTHGGFSVGAQTEDQKPNKGQENRPPTKFQQLGYGRWANVVDGGKGGARNRVASADSSSRISKASGGA